MDVEKFPMEQDNTGVLCHQVSKMKNPSPSLTLRLPRVLVPTSDTKGGVGPTSQLSHDSLDLEA